MAGFEGKGVDFDAAEAKEEEEGGDEMELKGS